jgi:hypothetical protein
LLRKKTVGWTSVPERQAATRATRMRTASRVPFMRTMRRTDTGSGDSTSSGRSLRVRPCASRRQSALLFSLVTGDGGAARVIETQVGRFELIEPGIIFWRVAFASSLDGYSAGEAASAAEALASGEPVVILADASGLGFADRKARDVLAEANIEGLVATGVIVSSRVVRFLAEQYARQTEGRGRAFEIFNAESVAMAWASEQLGRATE